MGADGAGGPAVNGVGQRRSRTKSEVRAAQCLPRIQSRLTHWLEAAIQEKHEVPGQRCIQDWHRRRNAGMPTPHTPQEECIVYAALKTSPFWHGAWPRTETSGGIMHLVPAGVVTEVVQHAVPKSASQALRRSARWHWLGMRTSCSSTAIMRLNNFCGRFSSIATGDLCGQRFGEPSLASMARQLWV